MYQTSIRNKKKHQSFNHIKTINYDINDAEEEYAYIINMLGNCRVTLISNTGIKCIGIICGSLRKFNKRVLIEKGDIVVITKSSVTDNKVYILHKYNTEQINNLINDNKLSSILINNYNNITSINNTTEHDIINITDNLEFNDD